MKKLSCMTFNKRKNSYLIMHISSPFFVVFMQITFCHKIYITKIKFIMKFFFKKRELLLRENFILKNFFQYFNNKSCINNDKEKNLLSHSAILNFVLKKGTRFRKQI